MSRLSTYAAVANALAVVSDERLATMLDEARPHGHSIGGRTSHLEIEGVPVFVKRIPLTDTERRRARSTANVFDLPMFYSYGVGSHGFGAWRELAAHTMTTNWALSDAYDGFPLMYHHRVLDGFPHPAEPVDIDGAVDYWAGSAAVRHRLTEISTASASLVVFLEHVPWTVNEWLTGRLAAGTIEDALSDLDGWLAGGVAFLRCSGFVHFDAHFNNLLTDGERVYFADFGLANSWSFEHSPAERQFVERHADYDRAETQMMIAWWIANRMSGADDPGAFLREVVAGRDPRELPPVARALVRRYAAVCVTMGEAFNRWRDESKHAPYPAEEFARLWAEA